MMQDSSVFLAFRLLRPHFLSLLTFFLQLFSLSHQCWPCMGLWRIVPNTKCFKTGRNWGKTCVPQMRTWYRGVRLEEEVSKISLCSGFNSFISFDLSIIDAEVVPGELLGPTDLTRASALRVYEPTEAIKIGKHKDFMLAAF